MNYTRNIPDGRPIPLKGPVFYKRPEPGRGPKPF